jgi:hypothetical protein
MVSQPGAMTVVGGNLIETRPKAGSPRMFPPPWREDETYPRRLQAADPKRDEVVGSISTAQFYAPLFHRASTRLESPQRPFSTWLCCATRADALVAVVLSRPLPWSRIHSHRQSCEAM